VKGEQWEVGSEEKPLVSLSVLKIPKDISEPLIGLGARVA
jgi:hypothetical protein